MFPDITPNLYQIERRFRRKNVASFRLSFQRGEVSVYLVFRNALASVELLDTAPDLRADDVLILQQPAILFFLRFKKVEQCFLRTRRADRVNLSFDPSLQGRVVDFNVHLRFQSVSSVTDA
jgi:hypothetical protein